MNMPIGLDSEVYDTEYEWMNSFEKESARFRENEQCETARHHYQYYTCTRTLTITCRNNNIT